MGVGEEAKELEKKNDDNYGMIYVLSRGNRKGEREGERMGYKQRQGSK